MVGAKHSIRLVVPFSEEVISLRRYPKFASCPETLFSVLSDNAYAVHDFLDSAPITTWTTCDYHARKIDDSVRPRLEDTLLLRVWVLLVVLRKS